MYVTQIDRYTVEIERIDAMNYWVIVTDDDGAEVAAEEKELPQAWANLPEAEIYRHLVSEVTVPAIVTPTGWDLIYDRIDDRYGDHSAR